jgi:hypothetical protein
LTSAVFGHGCPLDHFMTRARRGAGGRCMSRGVPGWVREARGWDGCVRALQPPTDFARLATLDPAELLQA